MLKNNLHKRYLWGRSWALTHNSKKISSMQELGAQIQCKNESLLTLTGDISGASTSDSHNPDAMCLDFLWHN